MTLIKARRPKYTPAYNHFPSFFRNFMDDDFIGNSRFSVPAINIVDENDHYKVELAAPGMNKSDFEINVENDILTVKGKKEIKDEDRNDNYIKREFSYAEFSKSFTLPETVNQDKIDANYKSGVLILDLPKLDAAKAKPVKEISIK